MKCATIYTVLGPGSAVVDGVSAPLVRGGGEALPGLPAACGIWALSDGQQPPQYQALGQALYIVTSFQALTLPRSREGIGQGPAPRFGTLPFHSHPTPHPLWPLLPLVLPPVSCGEVGEGWPGDPAGGFTSLSPFLTGLSLEEGKASAGGEHEFGDRRCSGPEPGHPVQW